MVRGPYKGNTCAYDALFHQKLLGRGFCPIRALCVKLRETCRPGIFRRSLGLEAITVRNVNEHEIDGRHCDTDTCQSGSEPKDVPWCHVAFCRRLGYQHLNIQFVLY
jgi:hypothetical protein